MARVFAAFGLALASLLTASIALLWPAAVPAQSPSKPVMRQQCPGLIAGVAPSIVPVTFQPGTLKPTEARITYIGHATFLLESPQGVRIATDYNDFVKPAVLPDVITMNHAHITHYTDHPDPRIKYVLRGWGLSPDKPARWNLQVKDVHIHNVPTNIRSWGGATERHGNSIFVFDIGSLCIAHLGHLHHTLTQQQLDEIGKVDVVMAPVDGTYTLDLDGMLEVLKSLKARVVIPMHFFSPDTLQRFIDRMKRDYAVVRSGTPSVVLSRATLPAKPEVLVLPGH